MLYFDNAATSFPKPPGVKEAVIKALDSFGNSARSAHEAALRALRCVELCRERAGKMFGCDSANVAFTANATEALNIAIGGAGGHIVSTAAEHNSVLRPLYRRGGHSIIDVDEYGGYEARDIARAIRADTGAVVIGHASNLTGRIHPVAEIGRLCRERKLIFIVDAAQSAGLIDIDMEEMGIDALCFTGHKALYGPQGTGGICLGRRFLPPSLMAGGSGAHSFETDHPKGMPDRLEAGTMNSHGLAGLSAGLEYVAEKGPEKLLAAALIVAGRFYEGLKAVPGLRFYGRYDDGPRLPIVALNVKDMPSDEAAARLADEHDIAVRAGAHCAPLLHRAFGTVRQGALRFSFSHFNTMDQADLAVSAVKALL